MKRSTKIRICHKVQADEMKYETLGIPGNQHCPPMAVGAKGQLKCCL
jgi:hypothetical protein